MVERRVALFSGSDRDVAICTFRSRPGGRGVETRACVETRAGVETRRAAHGGVASEMPMVAVEGQDEVDGPCAHASGLLSNSTKSAYAEL